METFLEIVTNKFIYIPILVWFGIQTFKVIWDLVETKKFNFKRILGAGGMPSSHSAVTMCIAVMIGRQEGFSTPIFALSLVLAIVVMYDAAGIRRAAGKQARLLNKIVNTPRTFYFAGTRKISRGFRAYSNTSICRCNYWNNSWYDILK